jgi:hypothetical protein
LFNRWVVPRPSWSIFDGWYEPSASTLSWAAFGPLLESAERVLEAERTALSGLIAEWESRLADIGGDPSQHDMRTFRPLRPNREEAWSDWLAHLLQHSQSGILARELFSPHLVGWPSEHFARPTVEREQSTEDGSRRSDVIVRWEAPARVVHVEVKIWDANFEKTFETAGKLRAAFKGAAWHDFLLLPEARVEAWNACLSTRPAEATHISVLTWNQVAVAMRRSLAVRDAEPIYWRTWSATLGAAVEQRILGHVPLEEAVRKLSALASLDRLVSTTFVLTEGQRDARRTTTSP